MSEKQLPWLAHYDPEVPPRLDYPGSPLAVLVEEKAVRQPERAALLFMGRKITYGELARLIASFAGSLARFGLKAGDRAALLLPNCPQFAIAYYAVQRLGATVIPVNPLSTERELEYIFRDAGVKAAVVLDLFAARAGEVRRRLSERGAPAPELIYTSIADFLPGTLALLYRFRQKLPEEARQAAGQGRKFMEMLGDAPGGPPEQVDLHRDPAVIIYTAGTTGNPKGVMLSGHALVVNALSGVYWVGLNAGDRLLAVLPVFHGFGMSVCLNAVLLGGGTSVLLPRYNPEEVLKTIQRYKINIFAGVPTMYIGMLNHPNFSRYDLTSLRGCFVGAAPLPPEIKSRFEKLTGGRLMEGYGLTEAVTAKCANPYLGTNKTGSIGIPFSDTVMKIVDLETGLRDMPPGEAGELIIQSPDLMLGYHNLPEETSRALRDGWLYTGDIARMDEEGYFYLVERKKDLIITGGFNVYPREVEDVIYSHPAVREACVVGVPDDYRGEAVIAYVVTRDGATATPEEIIDFCRERLVPYKAPRRVEFRDELPKSAIGKILRRRLREEVAAGDERQ